MSSSRGGRASDRSSATAGADVADDIDIADLLERLRAADAELVAARERVRHMQALETRLADAEQLIGSERQLQTEVSELRRRNDELLALLDRTYRSNSWRLTKPLRQAKDLARQTALDAVRQVRKGM